MRENEKYEVPDQELFEPAPDEGEGRGGLLKPFLKGFTAVVAIGLLLFLSGVYQLNILTETSRGSSAPEFSSLLTQEQSLILPLTIVIISEDSENSFSRSDITHIIENTNNIWAQASLSFSVKDVFRVSTSGDEAARFVQNPDDVPSQFRLQDDGGIRVFLVDALGGLNGIAFRGAQSVAVSRYTSFRDYRTLAHEIGHVLSLPHTEDLSRLMNSGGTGLILTQEEAERAYHQARLRK